MNTCFQFADQLGPGFRSLVYYAHLFPLSVIIFLSVYLIYKTKKSFLTILFSIFSFLFCLWLLSDLVTYISGNYNFLVFSWSQSDNINILFYCFAVYFAIVAIRGKDASWLEKTILFLITLPGFYITFTLGTAANFDLSWCNVTNSDFLTNYKLVIEILCVAYILIISGIGTWKQRRDAARRNSIIIIGVAFTLFLGTFGITEYLASIAGGVYTASLYGLFVLPIFLFMIVLAIVRERLFRVQSIGTQLLVYVMIIMVGTQFLFLENSTNMILNAITLILSISFGYLLIKNIRREEEYRKRIEKLANDLETANEKLKELDQLKSEFVSLATHQIRAPLTAIKGYLSEVFEGDYGPISKELEMPLRTVFQSTENLVEIVGDFLNISRIESGNMKYELAPLDLKQVVEETLSGLKPNFERAGLELKMEIPEGHNYEIYADIGKVKQVIGNLVDNAMKYTPKGSITVALKSDSQNQKVTFAISDTGIGIAPGVLPKLFQKFTRAKNANEVNIIGTGLGLYVARLMVEGQHGRVWAESPGTGKGSTFYMELPVAHVS